MTLEFNGPGGRDQGLTVLEISHDLAEVCRYATTVLCLGHEHVQMGPLREILTLDSLNKVYGAPVFQSQ